MEGDGVKEDTEATQFHFLGQFTQEETQFIQEEAQFQGKKGKESKKTSLLLLFATPWTAVHQASLSFKLMSIESVILSNHLILCCPLLLLPSVFQGIGSFPVGLLFPTGGQSIGASASVLSMNIQD